MPSGSGSCTRIEWTSGFGVEAVDHRLDLVLGRRRGQVHVEGPDADLLALLDLHLDVARARRIVAHEQGAETRGPTLGAEPRRAIGEFHLDALGDNVRRRVVGRSWVSSVAEVSFAGEHHHDLGRVRRVDDFLVAHRTARLDDRGDAGAGE